MKDINRILTSTNGVEPSASDTHTQAAGSSVDWKRRFQSRSVCPGTWIPRQESLKCMFPTRYLPRRDNTFKKTCRNLKLDLPPSKIELWLLASSYNVKPSAPTRPTGSWRQWLTYQSQSATASQIVSSLSSNTLTALQTSCEKNISLIIGCCHHQYLFLAFYVSGRVTLETSIWAPSAHWTEATCQNTGCLR